VHGFADGMFGISARNASKTKKTKKKKKKKKKQKTLSADRLGAALDTAVRRRPHVHYSPNSSAPSGSVRSALRGVFPTTTHARLSFLRSYPARHGRQIAPARPRSPTGTLATDQTSANCFQS